MSKYDTLAKNIYAHFGTRIEEAVRDTIVPPEFLAALISNECGKEWIASKLYYRFNESTPRFEPHVYAALKAVKAGKRANYNRTITKEDLAEACDDSLKALAKSYGATQIMGWHMIDNLKGTIADLRDPQKHLQYTVQLLMLDSKVDIKNKAWERVLRRWNTGKPNGKTYHDHYVPTGLAVLKAYREILDSKPAAEVKPVWDGGVAKEPVVEGVQAAEPAPPSPLKGLLSTVSIGGVATTVFTWLGANLDVVAIGVIAVCLLMIVLVFRKTIEDAIRHYLLPGKA
jgi:hypothetical protein